MKKRLHFSKMMSALCLALVTLVLSNRISAQTPYRPFTDGCEWSVSDEKYMTAGDTVIDGVSCLKLYRQISNQPFEFNLSDAQYFTAIRDDSVERKVYCLMPAGTKIYRDNNIVGQTEAPQEFLLYDYSLEEGNTDTIYTIFIEGDFYAVNEGIATYAGSSLIYLSDGTPHRMISLHINVNYHYLGDIWIEEIGSVRGFNNYLFMNDDLPDKKLLCFTNAEGAVYQTEADLDENPDDCYNRNYASSIADQENERFTLYPNPVSQSFAIGFTDQKESLKQVRVFDMLGKEVMNVENPSSNTVNIANLPAGMYVVRVLSQSGKGFSAKLVKE